MSVDYNSTLQFDRMTKVATALDAGATTGGSLKFLTSTGGVLATVPLNYPAASVTGPVLTVGVPVSDPDAAGNAFNSTPSAAAFYSATGLAIVTGLTVGTATTNDVVMASTAIVPHQIVTVTAFTITHST